jgi:hypothetical protein
MFDSLLVLLFIHDLLKDSVLLGLLNAVELAGFQFIIFGRVAGALRKEKEIIMNQTTPERNKALVLDAFNTLFNKRDYRVLASDSRIAGI